MGFFSNLFSGAKNLLSNVWNEVKQRGTTILTNSHFIGPFNSLTPEYVRTHPPKDPVDVGAYVHDKTYSEIAKARDANKISGDLAKKMIRESDEQFLHNTKENFKHNPWGASLGYAGIYLKNRLEDLGVLNPNQFVTAKRGGLVRKGAFHI